MLSRPAEGSFGPAGGDIPALARRPGVFESAQQQQSESDVSRSGRSARRVKRAELSARDLDHLLCPSLVSTRVGALLCLALGVGYSAFMIWALSTHKL